MPASPLWLTFQDWTSYQRKVILQLTNNLLDLATSVRADLPPYDLSATDPSEIYNIESSMFLLCKISWLVHGDLARLSSASQEWKESVINETLEQYKEYVIYINILTGSLPGLVVDALAAIKHFGMKDTQLDEACSRCTFLYYMIAFYQTFRQARFKLSLPAFANSMPEEFAREIAEKYAAKSGAKTYAPISSFSYFCRYTLPEFNMKRLVHHILVLALNLTHFEIDFQKAAKDLLVAPSLYVFLRFNLTNQVPKTHNQHRC